MLSTAFSLALLTTGAAIIVYKKLPRKVRRFIEKHSLLTDLVALIAIYALLGGTLTALFAGAMCGIMISILLHITNNEEDFMFLYDARDFIKEQLVQAKEVLAVYGQQYRAKKLEKDSVLAAA